MRCRQGKSAFPDVRRSELNTCEERVLQGHPRLQIVHGYLGDSTSPLVE